MTSYTNDPIDITSFTDKWGEEFVKTDKYIMSVTFQDLFYVPLFVSKAGKYVAFPLLAVGNLPHDACLVNFTNP